MKTALDPRHQHRQEIVQELFAWQAQAHLRTDNGKSKDKQISDQKALNLTKNLQIIDKIITQSAPEWEIDKINPIDLAILRLAVYELTIEHTEPPKVIIDEAIELAKEFGNESSPAFINGALGKALTNHSRVEKLIADKLGVETARLTPEANLQADLNITDLEVADLITFLEQNLSITVDGTNKITTIGMLLDLIDEQT